MSAARDFADMLKSATDLLSSTFKFDNTVKLETKTQDGLKVKTQGKLAASGFSGKLEGSFSRNNLEFKDLSIDTSSNVGGKMTLVGVADGLNLTFAAKDGLVAANKCSARFGFNYKKADLATFNMDVNVIDGPVVSADAMVNYQGVLVGGNVELDTGLRNAKAMDWTTYNVGLGYDGGDFVVGVTSAKKFSQFNGGFYQKVNADTKIAATVNYTVQDGEKKSAGDAVCLSVGGAYALSGDTTVNGKFNSKGQVSGSYTQAFNSAVTLIAAAQVNAMDLGSDDHKFGLTLKFKA